MHTYLNTKKISSQVIMMMMRRNAFELYSKSMIFFFLSEKILEKRKKKPSILIQMKTIKWNLLVYVSYIYTTLFGVYALSLNIFINACIAIYILFLLLIIYVRIIIFLCKYIYMKPIKWIRVTNNIIFMRYKNSSLSTISC